MDSSGKVAADVSLKAKNPEDAERTRRTLPEDIRGSKQKRISY
jgi:hypothetical protein